MEKRELHLTVYDEGDGMLSAHVQEYPGCFASATSWDQLMEAVGEAISLYLADDDNVVPFQPRPRPAFHQAEVLVSM